MRHAHAAATVWLSIAFCACAALIGIEDAELDPALGGGGSGGRGDDAGQDGGDAPALCETYCDAVLANCTEGFAQYASRSLCLDVCAVLPEGSEGATSGNSVQCRLRNATLALTTGEANVHCPAAGPGGNGLCGTNCEGFCSVMLETCPGRFGSATTCDEECQALDDNKAYDVSQQGGVTVQCRLYHVSAATQDQMSHCPHAAGEPPCQ